MVKLKERDDIYGNVKLTSFYEQLQALMLSLKKRKLPSTVSRAIDLNIKDINASYLEGDELAKYLKSKQTEILDILEKEAKLVPKNHFRNRWLGFGICMYGVPLGIVCGMIFDSMWFFPIGLPLGMLLGLATGVSMDKTALKEGRQLDVDIKY